MPIDSALKPSFVRVHVSFQDCKPLKSPYPAFEHPTIYSEDIEVNSIPIVCIEVTTIRWGTMTISAGSRSPRDCWILLLAF